ncbi:cellulase [Alcaligenaceae bacterium]|nr:cellulase [Alcaligenaceae bacterium]
MMGIRHRLLRLDPWIMRLWCALLLLLCQMPMASAQQHCTVHWPLWNDFRTHFVQDSGRVLDASTDKQHSSSEGQSYAMFFALVAGDRTTFDRLWEWSINNLGAGDLSQQLPSWIWGRADDNTWRVLDDNSASDADLWFVYALLEAGRLWQEPNYTRQAHALLALVESQELADLPGFGLMLLPGRRDFIKHEDNAWQLNPSYLPMPLLRRLQSESPSGPWGRIANNTAALMEVVSPLGLAPDWATYQVLDPSPLFITDPIKGPVGSYDAIRTYLWAGLTAPEDPLYSRMLKALNGMVALTRDQGGVPPESVDMTTGVSKGTGPFGFSAALMPYFKAKGQSVLLTQQQTRVDAMLRKSVLSDSSQQGQPPYYDYVLSLFGMGWINNYFRFKPDGTLSISWEKECLGTSN